MKISRFELAQIKRTAQNTSTLYNKKAKLEAQINKLNKEIEEIDKNINVWEAPIITMTKGYKSLDIVKKEDNKFVLNMDVLVEVSGSYYIPELASKQPEPVDAVEEDNTVGYTATEEAQESLYCTGLCEGSNSNSAEENKETTVAEEEKVKEVIKTTETPQENIDDTATTCVGNSWGNF